MKLVLATETQKRERDRLTHPEWGKKLTLDEYFAREQRLRRHPWAGNTMQTWLLTKGSAVLASCETFRMDSFIIDHGGKRRRGSAYGVASVFTEPALRGNGYATDMMAQLQDALSGQDAAIHSSILFSDVGAALYERSGYRARPGRDRWLPAAAQDVQVTPIDEGQVAAELHAVPLPELPHVIWPSPDQLDWHFERERIYSAALGHPRPGAVGARVGESRMFWCTYYASDLLAVLLCDARSDEDAATLLRAAQHAAFTAGVSRVQLWESAALGKWQNACAAYPSTEREGYLPMLHSFVGAVSADTWDFIPRALWI